jgi:hypothetical protein
MSYLHKSGDVASIIAEHGRRHVVQRQDIMDGVGDSHVRPRLNGGAAAHQHTPILGRRVC